jgi:DNA-binding NarL/FixJ family response regulator
MEERLNMNDNTAAVQILVASEPPTSPAPIKVWLVDDDDGFRTLLAGLLAKQQGIVCPRHFNSPDAVLSALASKTGPDVLLMDIQMRHQNGLDAIRPIKSLARSTRVLMLTTFYDSFGHSRAIEEGASGFLLKRWELHELVEHIRKPDASGVSRPRRRRTRPQIQPQGGGAAPCANRPAHAKWWGRLPLLRGILH